MINILSIVYRKLCAVWDESYWFPPGVNWTTLQSTPFEKYPDVGDLYLPILYAIVLLLIRFCFEWALARPLGRYLGIKDTYSELPSLFCKLKKLVFQTQHCDSKFCMNGTANGFCKNLASEPLKRLKSGSKRPQLINVKSTLDKFAESSWRFTYYFGIFIYGVVVLWDKAWFWDTSHCWHGYPFQTIHPEIWWYYMIEASFYWSLMLSQFVDVQRKDFWVNFIHHIATVLLMYFSWADNFVRIGSLVLIVHDAADFWMEAAKMSRYTKRHSLCNTLFTMFTVVWFLTRVGVYPFRIVYSTLVEAPALVGFYAAYYVFNSLLLLLLVLHVFWSVMILRIAVNAAKSGQTDDVRSDDEGDLDDVDHQMKSNHNNNYNISCSNLQLQHKVKSS